MGILSLVPNLLEAAEKSYPGHGAELLQAMDSVSTATFFLGVAVGVIGLMFALIALGMFKTYRDKNHAD